MDEVESIGLAAALGFAAIGTVLTCLSSDEKSTARPFFQFSAVAFSCRLLDWGMYLTWGTVSRILAVGLAGALIAVLLVETLRYIGRDRADIDQSGSIIG
jgi:hypothetical protein